MLTSPRAALGESLGIVLEPESPELPNTLSDNTLTPSIVSKDSAHLVIGIKPTTRSIIDS